MWTSSWSPVAAVKCVLALSRFRTAIRPEAIGLPQISGEVGGKLDGSKNATARVKATLHTNPLPALCAALLIALSSAMAGAQTTTTTTLAVTPTTAANGSVFKMTATVKAGGTSLTGGTVTFRDTYNSVTQVLGTVQVQSGNGTKGTAVLHQQLGGIGTHSIVATFNAPKTYSSSFSSTQSVTTTGLYPTTASITASGTAGNYSLITTIVGTGSLNHTPTGNVSILDTSNSNLLLGLQPLGAGTFGQQTVSGSTSPVTVGNNPISVAAGDFNNNGDIDLAVLNSTDKTISILNGNGTGGFTALGTTYTTGNGPVAIVVGDFNGDGKLDLAVANSADQTVSILLGNGNGTFNTGTPYSVSLVTITAIAMGDFNGDGIPDLAVAGTTATGGAVNILQGGGTGAFTNVTTSGIAVGNGPSSIVTGDLNGDGSLDFAVANLTDNTISVMLGNGSGTTFTAAAGSPFSTGAGTSPAAIAVADFNGDGQLDLAVAESNVKRVDIFKGNGDGTFSLLAGAPTTGTTPVAIVAGDFNADGKTDFAVTNKSDNTVTIMLGSGSGTVFTAGTSSPFAVGTTPVAITAGDFNGDGSVDLGVANSGSKNVSILLNQVTDTATVSMTGISIPGNGTHNVEASYPGDTNFNASISAKVGLTATNITTSTLLSANTTSPSYGQQVVLTATLQTSPTNVGSLTPTGNVTFKDGGTTIGTVAVTGGVATFNTTTLAVGTHSITASYAGDTNFLASASPALGVIVSKATPVITWANPSPITYGTLLSSTQLDATTTAPGTFAYSQAVSTLLAVGTYTINATFTPTDPTSYTMATASVTLVVNQATPQINWPTPGPISYGTALSGIQLDATVSVYTPVPLSTFYNVSGIYTDGTSFGTGGFDGGGNAYSSNLLGTSVTWNNITYQLGPTNAPDAVSNTTINLPAGHYATLNMLGALVNNATASNTFLVTYTDGTTSSFTQSLSDWVYPLNYTGETEITCVPYRDTSSGGQDTHLTCVYGYQIPLNSAKIAKSITLPATRNVVMLAMDLVSPPIPGTLVYNPPSGTVLPAGENTLSATFTPTDTTDYASASASVMELVNPANTLNLVWPTPAPITYGTALSSTQLDAVAQTVPGTTAVSLSAYYRVNAFETDGALFATGGFDNGGNAYSANQVGSSIVWNGQTFTLGPANLPDAVTSTTIALPQGNFSVMTLLGAAAAPGQTNQTFTLTYTDGTSVSGNFSISPWFNPQGYPGETVVSTTPYENTGGGDRINTTVYIYGYQIAIDSTKVVQSLTLPNNRNVVLMAMSLSTATTPTAIPGTYTYTPPAGTVPSVGTIPLNVLFTAANTNYGTATGSVNLVVNKAPLTVTANNENVPFGGTIPPYTDTIIGFVNGDTSSVVTGAASLTTTPATPTAPNNYTITAATGTLAATNYSFTFVNGTLTISKGTPTITFSVPNQTYGAAPFPVSATSNSTGAFTYTVVSGPATISGSTVTLTGAGTVVLQASEATDSNYAAATKNATFTVGLGTPTITFTVPNQTYGAAPFPVSATSNSTGAFTYTVVSGPATISGATVTLTGAGTVVLQASEAASSNYAAATKNATFTVGLGTPTITFSVPNQTYGAAPFPVSATSNSTGAFTYSVVSGPATISGATVTLTGAGTVVLQASEAADSNYAAATKNATFTVGLGTPTITFTVPNQTYGAAPFPVSATSNSTGAFTYTVVSGPATISGATVTLTGAGTVVLQASEAASSNYAAATKNATFTVGLGTPTITFSVPNQTYGAAPFPVSATSNSTGAFTYTVVSGPATISGSTVTLTGAGTVVLQASEAADSNYAAATKNATFTVGLGTPTITFTVPNQTYGAAPFPVSATSNSTGAFTYTVVSGPATITGSTVTLTGAGTVVLQASEAADSNYAAATKNATFTVGLGTPTITFSVPNQTYGAAPFPVSATSNSTGAFTYSVVSGPATITGSTVTLTGAGTVVLQASEAADSNYAAATKNATFTVGLGTPTITFSVPNQTYGAAPFPVSATSNSTGAFTYTVVSGPATISGSTVTLTGAGTVVLQASEAADSNYAAATKNATFTVGLGTPTITFTVPNQTYGAAPFPVSATSNSTGAFTYTVVSGPATITGSTVTLTGAGTVVLQASEAADSNYAAATKNATFTVGLGTPTITFSVPNQTYGAAPFPVSATSNSTGAFTYTVVSGPATISGSTVTLTGAGTVVLQASEAADSNYAAATKNATFTVGLGTPTITFTVPNQTYGAAPFPVSATSNSTGAFTYSVVSGPATISGATVTLTGAGTVVLQASEAADSNYAAATKNATFTVGLGTPTITFTVPNQTYGAAPFPVSATSNSTGAFTYSVVSGPATISGSTVTLTGAGTVVLQASEAADSNYAAATKNATFTVGLGTPTITFTVPNQTYGAAPFPVSATSNSTGAFTYTVVSGPATISGSTVTLTGAGTVVLQASEAADSNYAAATKNATFTVGLGTPTITFTVPNQTYGAAPFPVSATSNSTGAFTYYSGLRTRHHHRIHRHPDRCRHRRPASV